MVPHQSVSLEMWGFSDIARPKPDIFWTYWVWRVAGVAVVCSYAFNTRLDDEAIVEDANRRKLAAYNCLQHWVTQRLRGRKIADPYKLASGAVITVVTPDNPVPRPEYH